MTSFQAILAFFMLAFCLMIGLVAVNAVVEFFEESQKDVTIYSDDIEDTSSEPSATPEQTESEYDPEIYKILIMAGIGFAFVIGILITMVMLTTSSNSDRTHSNIPATEDFIEPSNPNPIPSPVDFYENSSRFVIIAQNIKKGDR